MNRTRRAAMLWFLAGAAMLAAGLMSKPIGSLAVAGGILLTLVGVRSLRSCRSRSAGHDIR